MNHIAQQALANALGNALSAPFEKSEHLTTEAEVELLSVSDIDTSGPRNHVMFLEGRKFAAEMIEASSATLSDPIARAQLIQKLIRSAIGRPPSRALGIKSVIEHMEKLAEEGFFLVKAPVEDKP